MWSPTSAPTRWSVSFLRDSTSRRPGPAVLRCRGRYRPSCMLKYVFVLGVLGAASCGRGTVTLDLEVPAVTPLDPLAQGELARLAWFRLRRDSDGSALVQTRFAASQ